MAEGLVAEVTLVFVVYLHVSGELAALGRGVITNIALVRFLPGVRPPVDRQVGEVDKHLAAVLTRVPACDDTALGPGTGLHGRRVVVHQPFQLKQTH